MPAVLVHGVPETERVWDALRSRLSRTDVVALSLPGFGCPLPDGFEPTMDGYADWLIAELERIDGPIDLVGHDWGGGFTVRAVSLRPDLVRTWVTDAAAVADTQSEWHDLAKIWQTPGDGEAFMESWLATDSEQRMGIFTSSGASEETARAIADAFDRTMADSILTLYRSATQVHLEWAPAFVDIPVAGLVIVAGRDPYLSARLSQQAAERAGAGVARLEDRGHWWMLEDPGAGAQVLEAFWASVS